MRDVYLNIMRHALLSAHSRKSVTTAEQKQPKRRRRRSDDGTEKTKEPEREGERNLPKQWDFILERDTLHIYTLVQIIRELKIVEEDQSASF